MLVMAIDLTELTTFSLLQLLGTSAIVSGGVSAFVNYFMTMKALKKTKVVELIENKLDLYSFIIFYFDKMRFKGEALKNIQNEKSEEEIYVYSANENIKEIFRPIDEKVENKYYLFNQEIFEQYIYVKTLFSHASTKEAVPKLRKMLVDEYNTSIVIEYEKLTGKKIEKLK
jgi:hypothetical protein